MRDIEQDIERYTARRRETLVAIDEINATTTLDEVAADLHKFTENLVLVMQYGLPDEVRTVQARIAALREQYDGPSPAEALQGPGGMQFLQGGLWMFEQIAIVR